MFKNKDDKEMKLLMVGDSNWDYYHDTSGNLVISYAKENTGAKNSFFGNRSYFSSYIEEYNLHDKLTAYGKEFVK